MKHEKLKEASARDLAVRALRDRSGNVTAHLARISEESNLSSADRGLAYEITVGTLRHMGTLDAIIKAYLDMPTRKLKAPVREILQIAIYQLLFLDRIPAFAAVDEAVRQVHRYNHKRQAGLVNGVLRTIIREMSAPTERALAPEPSEYNLPVSPTKDRRFARPVLPDPFKNTAEYLAAAYSLPIDLAARWLEQFNWPKPVTKIAMHTCCRPPIIVRPNTLKLDTNELLEIFANEGVAAKPHCNGFSIVLNSAENLASLESFKKGLFQPQDATATAVVEDMRLKPGMRVLDFCASPGTKTTHMAAKMCNDGEIVAVDVSNEKLRRINENCERLGVNIVKTLHAEKAGSLDIRGFDVVLADVPCSNTGVLARRVEARWRYDAGAISKLLRDQQFLATAAGEFVRSGGQLIYSTCSIDSEENERVVKHISKHLNHLSLRHKHTTLPGGFDDPTTWHDGGFVATFG